MTLDTLLYCFLAFLLGGAVGMTAMASVILGAQADKDADDIRRKTVEEMARESQR